MQPFSITKTIDSEDHYHPAIRMPNGDVVMHNETFDLEDAAAAYARAICDVLDSLQSRTLEKLGFSIQ